MVMRTWRNGLPDLPPPVAGGIPVVDLRPERQAAPAGMHELPEGLALVLLQGFQGKDVKGLRLRIAAGCLPQPGGCRSASSRWPSAWQMTTFFPPRDFLDGRRLVGVKKANPLPFQYPVQNGRQLMLRLRKTRLLGGEILMVGHLGGVKAVPFQVFDKLAHRIFLKKSRERSNPLLYS